MSTLCQAHKLQFRTQLGSEQYAVCVSAALEKFSATLSIFLRQHPRAADIQVDAVSAFNEMLRETMLEEIEKFFPQLLNAFALWLARESVVVLYTIDGRTIEYRTCVGVDQGCHGSPIAFAFGMQRALRKIRERIEALLHEAQ